MGSYAVFVMSAQRLAAIEYASAMRILCREHHVYDEDGRIRLPFGDHDTAVRHQEMAAAMSKINRVLRGLEPAPEEKPYERPSHSLHRVE